MNCRNVNHTCVRSCRRRQPRFLTDSSLRLRLEKNGKGKQDVSYEVGKILRVELMTNLLPPVMTTI